MRRSLAAFGGLAALSLTMGLLSGCTTPGSSSSTSGGPAGETLTISTPSEPDSLDPTVANTFVANMVFTTFCEKLYDVDSHLNIVPQLAASMPKVASDGKAMDIKIRSGIEFNDGSPLDAAAVKASLDRDLTLKGSARVSDLESVKSVSVKDPMTVHIALKHPSCRADRAVHQPARFGDVGISTEKGRRGLRQESGLRRPVQIQEPGQWHVDDLRQIRRLL